MVPITASESDYINLCNLARIRILRILLREARLAPSAPPEEEPTHG